ncbi:hypothetical protein QWY85_20035 [Neolewinella lacunae]|uniref:Uncharacterized protein n=1 Tax=Neolewinella lacunae TaxID=1517758 RepID=A0A923PRW2_9BACT|nr:hypothetical protein [Neolewinella lacunae]MBC6996348.1 hypothetical protein [Neolewinella lacunae]MDN3636971.1 hypothetical protein [Neolewinella lacunae]
MDTIITLLLIYAAYRGYKWYSAVQERVNAGPPPHPGVGDETNGKTNNRGREDDYIEYEELP